jgi:hypothetical protein
MTTMVMRVCMDGVLKFWHGNVLCSACFVSNNANLSISLEIKLRCNCFVTVHKNRFCTCILIVNMYSQMIFFHALEIIYFHKIHFHCHYISGKLHEWKIPERGVKQFKTNCSDISRTVFRSTEALLKHSFSSIHYNLTVHYYISYWEWKSSLLDKVHPK